MSFRENITAEQENAVAFLDSKGRLGRQVEKALRPIFHAEASLDVYVSIRKDKGMSIKFIPLHTSPEWKSEWKDWKDVKVDNKGVS